VVSNGEFGSGGEEVEEELLEVDRIQIRQPEPEKRIHLGNL
jgi:hypothetical protein